MSLFLRYDDLVSIVLLAVITVVVYRLLTLQFVPSNGLCKKRVVEMLSDNQPNETWSLVGDRVVLGSVGLQPLHIGPSESNVKRLNIPRESRDLARSGFCTRWSHDENIVDTFQLTVDEKTATMDVARLDQATGWQTDLWLKQAPLLRV